MEILWTCLVVGSIAGLMGLVIGLFFSDSLIKLIRRIQGDRNEKEIQNLKAQIADLESQIQIKNGYWEETDDGFLRLETPDAVIEVKKSSLPGIHKQEVA